MKVWHIRLSQYGRGFANPSTFAEKLAAYIKGWRPFHNLWWSIPSANQRRLETRRYRKAVK